MRTTDQELARILISTVFLAHLSYPSHIYVRVKQVAQARLGEMINLSGHMLLSFKNVWLSNKRFHSSINWGNFIMRSPVLGALSWLVSMIRQSITSYCVILLSVSISPQLFLNMRIDGAAWWVCIPGAISCQLRRSAMFVMQFVVVLEHRNWWKNSSSCY